MWSTPPRHQHHGRLRIRSLQRRLIPKLLDILHSLYLVPDLGTLLEDPKFYQQAGINKIVLLCHLKYLNVRANWSTIYSLSSDIGKLHGLQILDMGYTCITTLPTKITKLRDIRVIRCNPYQDKRSTLCYTCMQSELPQTKFTIMSWDTCDLIKFLDINWILSELCSLSPKFFRQVVREVIDAIKRWLSDHVKPMPKAIRSLRQWSRYPLQSSSSPISAIGSYLDTLTWDNTDPSRSFHIT
jgi:hypothetical protein